MSDKPGKIEHYEKRFGIIAVEKGFITPEDLIEAMRIQVREDIQLGTHRLIGEILLEMDKMTATKIEEVVKSLLHKRR